MVAISPAVREQVAYRMSYSAPPSDCVHGWRGVGGGMHLACWWKGTLYRMDIFPYSVETETETVGSVATTRPPVARSHSYHAAILRFVMLA